MLEQWLNETQLALAILKESQHALSDKPLADKKKLYPMLTIDYGIAVLEAEARWCKQSIISLA